MDLTFGPDAIGGAINFITDIDYNNSYSINGFNLDNNSVLIIIKPKLLKMIGI